MKKVRKSSERFPKVHFLQYERFSQFSFFKRWCFLQRFSPFQPQAFRNDILVLLHFAKNNVKKITKSTLRTFHRLYGRARFREKVVSKQISRTLFCVGFAKQKWNVISRGPVVLGSWKNTVFYKSIGTCELRCFDFRDQSALVYVGEKTGKAQYFGVILLHFSDFVLPAKIFNIFSKLPYKDDSFPNIVFLKISVLARVNFGVLFSTTKVP